MEGAPTLFAREDGVETARAIVQPILGGTTPIFTEPGSWGPAEAARLAAEVGGWHSPAQGREEA